MQLPLLIDSTVGKLFYAKLDCVVAFALYSFVNLVIMKPLQTMSRHMSMGLVRLMIFISIINTVMTTRYQFEFEWWLFWIHMRVFYSWSGQGIGQTICKKQSETFHFG
jgi:hypothetical protein